MTNPQPTQPNQNAKYEGITNRFLESSKQHSKGLEDAVAIAWANQVQAKKDNHGEGMGTALYDAGQKYVREQVYGITGALPGNEDFQTQADGIFEETSGLHKAQLTDRFKDSKEVHLQDVLPVTQSAREAVAKSMHGILGIRLGQLGDTDFEPFRDYVIGMASGVGLTIGKDKIPTLHAAIQMYTQQVLPMYAEDAARKEKLGRINASYQK